MSRGWVGRLCGDCARWRAVGGCARLTVHAGGDSARRPGHAVLAIPLRAPGHASVLAIPLRARNSCAPRAPTTAHLGDHARAARLALHARVHNHHAIAGAVHGAGDGAACDCIRAVAAVRGCDGAGRRDRGGVRRRVRGGREQRAAADAEGGWQRQAPKGEVHTVGKHEHGSVGSDDNTETVSLGVSRPKKS